QRHDLLPTHVNPWTAVTTKLHFGHNGKPVSGCDFKFFTEEEWAGLGRTHDNIDGKEFEDGFVEMKGRAEVRLGEKFHYLLGKRHFYQSVQPEILQTYLCAGPAVAEVSRETKPGRYADITKSANIYFPLPPLAAPTTLIDTPGINDSTHLRHRITREIIKGADIYIVVLTARDPLASSDVALLELLRGMEKRRIIVFINRIDELAGQAGAMDVIVRHVRRKLDKLFQGASIPIVVGSARWAGLPSSKASYKQILSEIQSPAFQAVAARKAIKIPPEAELEEDKAAIGKILRSTSGIDSITRLLSLFMLSGFISQHSSGVAQALSEAAAIPAKNGCRQLRSTMEQLRALINEAADKPDCQQLLANLEALIAKVEQRQSDVETGVSPTIRAEIERLDAALGNELKTQKIISLDDDSPDAKHETGPDYSAASQPEPPNVSGSDDRATANTSESADWFSSVKEVTVDFLLKTFSENPKRDTPVQEPMTERRASLTVPVTQRSKEVAIQSGKAWWSDWISQNQIFADQNEEPNEFASGNNAGITDNSDPSGKSRLNALLANPHGLIAEGAIETLTNLLEAFEAIQLVASDTPQSDGSALAELLAHHDLLINNSCSAIAMHEYTVNKLKALFTLPSSIS
nr:dynamin family protein [Hyphomicrobiales bacterium]